MTKNVKFYSNIWSTFYEKISARSEWPNAAVVWCDAVVRCSGGVVRCRWCGDDAPMR